MDPWARFDEIALVDPAALDERERQLQAFGWLRTEVNHGGFDALLFNSAGDLVPVALRAARDAGAVDLVALVERVVEPLGDPYPTDTTKRQAVLARLGAAFADSLEPLDAEYLALEARTDLDVAMRSLLAVGPVGQAGGVSAPRSRLSAQHPSVAAAVAALPAERRAVAVRDVVSEAARACGVLELCESADDLEGLVGRLDDDAWRAQAAEQSGDRPDPAYDAAFRRARAAAAWRDATMASDPDGADDAIYEALHALGGDPAAEARVREVLHGQGEGVA